MMHWQPITEFKNTNGDYLVWYDIDQGYYADAMFDEGFWYNSDGRMLRPHELNSITHFLIITEPTKP
jgi:hypothetical protein